MQSEGSKPFEFEEFTGGLVFGKKYIITPDTEIGKKLAEGDYQRRVKTDRNGMHTYIQGRNEYGI